MTNQQENWEKEFDTFMDTLPKRVGETPCALLKVFISDLLTKQREEMNDCSCREKWTFGVVHRKDNPCYWPPREELTPLAQRQHYFDEGHASLKAELREAINALEPHTTFTTLEYVEATEIGYKRAQVDMLLLLDQVK